MVCSYCLGASLNVYAQSYPQHAIKLIVPFSPGGGNDNIGRLIAKHLSDALDQPVIVENRAGAGGSLGADFVAKSPPDGYTLFLGGVGSLVLNPSLQKNLSYHPVKDFDPIILIASAPSVLVIHPNNKINSLTELTQYLKKNPNSLNFASNGNGSSAQLAAVMYTNMAKVQMIHVPYKGLSPALNDLLSNQVQLMFSSMVAMMPFIQNNKLIPLAVTSKKRSNLLPQVPSIAELGYPDYASGSWYGILTPHGTPLAIQQKLHESLKTIIALPEVKSLLAKEGAEVIGGSSQDFANFIQSELTKTKRLVIESGIQIE